MNVNMDYGLEPLIGTLGIKAFLYQNYNGVFPN